MTLIFASVYEKIGIFGGDILASEPKGSDHQKIESPIGGDVSGLGVKGYQPSSFVQKIYIARDDLAFLWSGRRVFAESIIRKMKDVIYEEIVGMRTEEVRVKFKINEEEYSNCDVVIIMIHDEGSSTVNLTDCLYADLSEKRFICDGSGREHFIRNVPSIQIKRVVPTEINSVDKFNELMLSIMSRIGVSLVSDGTDKETVEKYMYGCWIDLFNSIGFFRHVPYMVKLWVYKDGKLDEKWPILTGDRFGSDLVIRTYNWSSVLRKTLIVPSIVADLSCFNPEISHPDPVYIMHLCIEVSEKKDEESGVVVIVENISDCKGRVYNDDYGFQYIFSTEIYDRIISSFDLKVSD